MKKLIKEKQLKAVIEGLRHIANSGDGSSIQLSNKSCKRLLEKIEKLEEEVEDLREDNYTYHQLIRMENKREYRSKFLKEFQEEFGTNTFPDYDEIYKRYDKVKKEKQKLEKIIIEQDKEQRKLFNHIAKDDYKQRINKAIEFIEEHNVIGTNKEYLPSGIEKCYSLELMEILRGDKE